MHWAQGLCEQVAESLGLPNLARTIRLLKAIGATLVRSIDPTITLAPTVQVAIYPMQGNLRCDLMLTPDPPQWDPTSSSSRPTAPRNTHSPMGPPPPHGTHTASWDLHRPMGPSWKSHRPVGPPPPHRTYATGTRYKRHGPWAGIQPADAALDACGTAGRVRHSGAPPGHLRPLTAPSLRLTPDSCNNHGTISCI